MPRPTLLPTSLARLLFAPFLMLHAAGIAEAGEPLRVLLIDGQNNHKWEETTPLIVQTLEGAEAGGAEAGGAEAGDAETGERRRFTVDVVTTPPAGGDMSGFKPEFSRYDVVVSNYNGQPWSPATQAAFEAYVSGGGGFVSVHAADNAFPEWPAYNRMIGLGGWGGRTEKDGPYLRWRDNQIVRDPTPGRGGSHGRRHPFLVVVRNAEHPITRGLPRSWMQAEDELYGQLRGPAENLDVLATAYSDPSTGGSGEHEPILMAVEYGQGRVFHTTLGHDTTAMRGVAFQVTLQRGTEWAATGEVTLPAVDRQTLPSDAPAVRDPATLISAPNRGKASQTSNAPAATRISASAPPEPGTAGWMPLFNGQNLQGWAQKNGTARYTVEDGVIVGRTTVGSPNSFLCTERDYHNFELSFEVKLDEGLNSGVQIRSKSLSSVKNGRVHGPQVEIESSPGEAGYLYSEGTGRNWLSKSHSIENAFQNGQWNQYLVRAVGPRLQTWVNGQKIEDLSDKESSQEGFLGLQVHSIGKDEGPFEVRWRNLQIRPLPDDAVLE
ncbi:family 16 glycoside hydrolase [Candidatus Laterigemmans baculatus]|uniref:family 16 glycoside hydrolase n=1 Tax=Candidatus Laterigemmans baculatus TaxID=2770505 RepID=UPI0013DD4F37|nr:family 16 glycoside hydrolase [Candidatus Laterigemmans baculatus]